MNAIELQTLLIDENSTLISDVRDDDGVLLFASIELFM